MDKFHCCGHSIVIMEQSEFVKMLTDATAKGYMSGHSAGHLKGYKLGKECESWML